MRLFIVRHGIAVDRLSPNVTCDEERWLTEEGKTKTFLVTRVDEKTVTIDGNNPLCGREVIFRLEILGVRDATEEEITHGGPVQSAPDLDGIAGAGGKLKSIHE